jgi:hypothetical protein
VTDNDAPKPVSTADLWQAADQITRTHRQRLQRDDGHSTYTEHVTLPSLWDQLVEAIDSGSGKHTRGTQRSKAPCDDSALALTITIAGDVRDGCLAAHLKRSRDVPRDLRAIVSHVIATGDQDAMRTTLATLRSWIGRIKATISNDPDRTWRMHGAACRVCSSTTVPVWDADGTESRAPALIVHSGDGVIDKIVCGFCGSTLTGPDLTSIVLDTLRRADGLHDHREAV